MKITLSKKQWELIGRKTDWIKQSVQTGTSDIILTQLTSLSEYINYFKNAIKYNRSLSWYDENARKILDDGISEIVGRVDDIKKTAKR